MNASPWQRALGESIRDLHPALRAYFEAIPEGSVGVGNGMFAQVGTPRRWLWPLLAVVGRGGALRAVWEHDVNFTVTNHAASDSVRAVRTFHFSGGDWDMVDEVALSNGLLTDRLGVVPRDVVIV